jgi:hypothetical protein
MSGINGDKARFNRRRKQKIQRRARQRVMLESHFKPANSTVPAGKDKQKEKLA